MVDGDAIEPGAKAAASLERRQAGQRLDDDFLCRVLRVLWMTQHADGDVVDPRLVPADQCLQRQTIAGLRLGDEALVVEILGVIVCKGVLDVHHLLPLRHSRPVSVTGRLTYTFGFT